MKSVFRDFGSLLLIALCIGAIVLGVGRLGSNSANWTPVEAKVVSVGEYFCTGDRHGREYCYQITYQYNVGGIDYTGSYNELVVLKSRLGEWRMVYYDPEDPGTSVTLRGQIEFDGAVIVGIGLLFFLWAALRIFTRRKAKQKSRTSRARMGRGKRPHPTTDPVPGRFP